MKCLRLGGGFDSLPPKAALYSVGVFIMCGAYFSFRPISAFVTSDVAFFPRWRVVKSRFSEIFSEKSTSKFSQGQSGRFLVLSFCFSIPIHFAV